MTLCEVFPYTMWCTLSLRGRSFDKVHRLVGYSRIGHKLQSGPTLAFLLWLSEFKIKTSFGFLIKKSGVLFLIFFETSKNELVQPKTMFLAIQRKFDRFPIIAICRQFRNIRAHSQYYCPHTPGGYSQWQSQTVARQEGKCLAPGNNKFYIPQFFKLYDRLKIIIICQIRISK